MLKPPVRSHRQPPPIEALGDGLPGEAATDRTLAPYHQDDLCVIEDQEGLLAKTHVLDDDDEIETADFDQSFLSRPSLHRHHGIRDLSERLLKPLEQHQRMAVVFGQPRKAVIGRFYRRWKDDQHDDAGELIGIGNYTGVPRTARCFDIDKSLLPPGQWNADLPQRAIRHLLGEIRKHAPELEGVTCHVHHSSSAGLDELCGEACRKISAHLWFVTSKPITGKQLKAWMLVKNAEAGLKLFDPAPTTPNQVLYTANPCFEGVDDPLYDRSFLIEGERDTLDLDVPDDTGQAFVSTGTHYENAGKWLDLMGTSEHGFHDPIIHHA
ncbi:MAG: hypothetical protein AAGA21_22015 [Pseudomonadota bacterium]